MMDAHKKTASAGWRMGGFFVASSLYQKELECHE